MAKAFLLNDDSVSSLEFMALLKFTTLISCNPELKKEILNFYVKTNSKYSWNQFIELKTNAILKNLRLPETLLEKVVSAVLVIGMRFVFWARYHERVLGLSNDFSLHFINSSLFTAQGKIDTKKAAKELMQVNTLSIPQKYTIACVYCFQDDIPVLFSKLSREDIAEYYFGEHSKLVRYWSRYLKDKLEDETTRDRQILFFAIESGSKATVEYCFQKAFLRGGKLDLVFAALKAINHIDSANGEMQIIRFVNIKFWVPADYYMDIVIFLLSKMSQKELIDFLMRDIEESNNLSGNRGRSRVLSCLLSWPYQDIFMKTANLMWEFLPEITYGELLLEISDKFDPVDSWNLYYGEEKFNDYRSLFMKFWRQSPERFKRFVFRKKVDGVTVGVKLIKGLLKFKNSFPENKTIIELILASSSDKEKEDVFVFIQQSEFFIELMREGKWSAMDVLAVNLLSTKEEVEKFKREFIFSRKAKCTCLNFVFDAKDKFNSVGSAFKFNSVGSAFKWSALPEEEIDKLKKEMVRFPDTRGKCGDLVCKDKLETFDKFINCFFSLAEERKVFKKHVLYTDEVMERYVELVAIEASDEFINLFFSSEEDIKQYKKDVADRVGGDFCGKIISRFSAKDDFLWLFEGKCIIEGEKWETIEKFLTWIFSSEKEIDEFKRKKIVLPYVHHDLILKGQFDEAERYFAWLGLCAEEVKELKKDDFFNTYMIDETFRNLFYAEKKNAFFYHIFTYFGSNQEAIELLLRWYLTDRETVLEFSTEFRLKYLGNDSEDETKNAIAFKNFDLLIAQHLNDLEEENKGMKRKSENSFSSKRFRL